MMWRFGSWLLSRLRTSGRSPGSAAGIWTPWPGCSCSRYGWLSGWAWCAWGGSPWTGTKLRANASKHKAMSYARLVDKEQVVEAEVAELEAAVADLLADAEATDTAEDARYGPDGKDVDLPAELDRREKRLARLQAARAQIEAEAAAKGPGEGRSRPDPPSGGCRRRRRRSGGRRRRAGCRAGEAETQGAGQLHRPRVQDHEKQ
jgi:hypothetical protein